MLNNAGRAPEDVALLETRQESLLMLIRDLLKRNEELRQKVARLEELAAPAPGGMI
jgi:vacuolar-type H+-ATPase subunit D/Vma8